MWFKLDDNFHNHPKVVRAGNAAVGLWIRCATYSAQYELDGFVPRSTMLAYSEHPTQQTTLQRVSMWVPTDGGVQIPDFLEYQPSSAMLKERRAADAVRKQAQRDAALRNGHLR